MSMEVTLCSDVVIDSIDGDPIREAWVDKSGALHLRGWEGSVRVYHSREWSCYERLSDKRHAIQTHREAGGVRVACRCGWIGDIHGGYSYGEKSDAAAAEYREHWEKVLARCDVIKEGP